MSAPIQASASVQVVPASNYVRSSTRIPARQPGDAGVTSIVGSFQGVNLYLDSRPYSIFGVTGEPAVSLREAKRRSKPGRGRRAPCDRDCFVASNIEPSRFELSS